MYSQDDIQYALEFTQILLEPDRRIDTFGSTSFEFHIISELMDSANETRVREGIIHADRPTIIKPDPYTDLELRGLVNRLRLLLNGCMKTLQIYQY